ncbi:MAG TPA: sigma-E factor regulatory protein RseB domain-containing protein [Acidimicrobiales bacterium]|nr:sigma-E factor regulatory protein RseB domain-containing protein [Acidimicrobiales bacterium]
MRPLVAGTALVLAAAAWSPAVAAPADDPLVQARRAARDHSFTGQVEVVWRDAGREHKATVDVRSANGSLVVSGTKTVMDTGDRARFVRRREGGWELLWSASSPSAAAPSPSTKYRTAETGTTAVADRAARVLEVREGAMLRQRLALDMQTNLVLRREHLATDGRVERVVTFTSLKIPDQPPVPAPPSSSEDHAGRAISAVSAPFSAPPVLREGYRRVGLYEDGGVVQALYNDGLYDLSVFEQRGRLNRGDVPASGRRLKLGDRRAWGYTWPGGHMLLWHAEGTVYAMVSDAPMEHLIAAADSLPTAGLSLSLGDRLRRICRSLVRL